MTKCLVQASAAIELYFYDELPPDERASVQQHLRGCVECRGALDELRAIREALAARPDVSAPPAGDWAPFMARLQARVGQDEAAAFDRPGVIGARARHRIAPYLAVAALLALVTLSVLVVFSGRRGPADDTVVRQAASGTPEAAGSDGNANAALAALGEQHFERSKLVVLGLATRDPEQAGAADWAYERQLASSLLTDTRLYRQLAEQQGMPALAGVMRDLELVLLETSMAEQTDAQSLERVQRLIRRRDLITKMDVIRTAGLAP